MTFLPAWDLTQPYSGLESPEFQSDVALLQEKLTALETMMGQHGVAGMNDHMIAPNGQTIQLFEDLATQFNEVLGLAGQLAAYTQMHIIANTANEQAHIADGQLRQAIAYLLFLGKQYTHWAARIEPLDELYARSEIAKQYQFNVTMARLEAGHLLPLAEEAIVGEMSLTGGEAWITMANGLLARLRVQGVDGKDLSWMEAAQVMAFASEREQRQNAYFAMQEAIQTVSFPVASALNAIKGETLWLARRRGWDSPLDSILASNVISEKSLTAMLDACWRAFPDFHPYLKAKANRMGLSALSWYDMFAPLHSGSQEQWQWERASQFIIKRFGDYSPELARLAHNMFTQGGVDAQMRPGKAAQDCCIFVPPAFNRISINYSPTFTQVVRLAHELGHAYHHNLLASMPPMQRVAPLGLNEIASIFCQELITAHTGDASLEDEKMLLEAIMVEITANVMTAVADFDFEQRLFERRLQGEVGVDELCQMQVEALTAVYGDALNAQEAQPFRWAYLPHLVGSCYYNFPYTFGLLLAMGLFAQYEKQPTGFQERFNLFLTNSGNGFAADLVRTHLNIDIEDVSFWQAGLATLRGKMERYLGIITCQIH